MSGAHGESKRPSPATTAADGYLLRGICTWFSARPQVSMAVLAIAYCVLATAILPYYPSIYRDEPWHSSFVYSTMVPPPQSVPRLFNFAPLNQTPSQSIVFRTILGSAYSAFGYDFLVGRTVSLVVGLGVLALCYVVLANSGIPRPLAFLVVLCAGTIERFVWSSHVVRYEIYVCFVLTLALLVMLRNSSGRKARASTDLLVGALCGLCLWVYDTGMVVGFAFGFVYLLRFLLTRSHGNRPIALGRLLAFGAAAAPLFAVWYTVNAHFDSAYLSNAARLVESLQDSYLTGVPAGLRWLAGLRGFFRVPRSLAGYFLSPAWRSHMPEILVLVPAAVSCVRRARLRQMHASEREALALLAGLWLGFSLAGYMAFYYWVLFLPAVLVLIAHSAYHLGRRFGERRLVQIGVAWVLLVVAAQLALVPYPYHNRDYSSAVRDLRALLPTTSAGQGVMGPVLFRFGFPRRPFAFERDFDYMHAALGTSLQQYCSLYNIGYVVTLTKVEQEDRFLVQRGSEHPGSELVGRVEMPTYPGSILLPGSSVREVLHVWSLHDAGQTTKRLLSEGPV